MERLNVGEKKAIGEALDQIHWRSIEESTNTMAGNNKSGIFQRVGRRDKTYKEVLSDLKQEAKNDLDDGWTKVSYRKKTSLNQSYRRADQATTIFLHNIPEDTSGRDLWSLFQSCGNIIDISCQRREMSKGRDMVSLKQLVNWKLVL